jgi:hypothetical protein
MARQRFDSSALDVWWEQQDLDVVELGNGTLFLSELQVFARIHGTDEIVTLWLEVRDGRPIVTALMVAGAPDVGVSVSAVHDLPLGAILDEVIARVGASTLALVRAHQAAVAGRPHQFLSPEEASRARRGAAVSLRGKPVRDEDLRLVAEIVRSSEYAPRKRVAEQLHLSDRTASRWIATAKDRGYLDEEGDGE